MFSQSAGHLGRHEQSTYMSKKEQGCLNLIHGWMDGTCYRLRSCPQNACRCWMPSTAWASTSTTRCSMRPCTHLTRTATVQSSTRNSCPHCSPHFPRATRCEHPNLAGFRITKPEVLALGVLPPCHLALQRREASRSAASQHALALRRWEFLIERRGGLCSVGMLGWALAEDSHRWWQCGALSPVFAITRAASGSRASSCNVIRPLDKPCHGHSCKDQQVEARSCLRCDQLLEGTTLPCTATT